MFEQGSAGLAPTASVMTPSFKSIILQRFPEGASCMEDILQETYLEIFRNLSRLRFPITFVRWANTICSHKTDRYLAAYCRQKAHIIFPNAEGSEDACNRNRVLPGPFPSISQFEIYTDLTAGIRALPEVQQRCIYYFYYRGMKAREISALLGLNENTVKGYLRKARISLKEELKCA